MQEKISVIGGGSWGTTIANLLSINGYSTILYVLEKDVMDEINNLHTNNTFLKDVILDTNLVANLISNFSKNTAKNVVWAVPTIYSRQLAEKFSSCLENCSVLVASKGIETVSLKPVLSLMQEIVTANFSILSGPTFALEVANEKPTAVSVASKKENESKMWQGKLSNNYFRVYTTKDTIGVELGGSMKNIIAIATGISDGLDFGYNARAGIITRGLAEITKIGIKLGGIMETFMGLSGVGDLVLTCTGDLSRNRQVGMKLAQGLNISEIREGMKMIAEGVYTVKAAKILSEKFGVNMPIVEEVYNIIYEGKNAYASVIDLMNRPLKGERMF